MATTMVALTWCDRHLADKDEQVPASAMPEIQGAQLDLCDDCAAPLMEVLALYETYGSKGKRTPQLASVRKRAAAPRVRSDSVPAAGGLPCPKALCDSVLRNRASLGAHARQNHGMTLGELEGKPVAYTCETCGAGFTTHQGISLHARKHEREKSAAAS